MCQYCTIITNWNRNINSQIQSQIEIITHIYYNLSRWFFINLFVCYFDTSWETPDVPTDPTVVKVRAFVRKKKKRVRKKILFPIQIVKVLTRFVVVCNFLTAFTASRPGILCQKPTKPAQLLLPPIPAPVLEWIRRNEFVNFDFLLPNNVQSKAEVRPTYLMSLNNSDPAQDPRPTIVLRDNNSSSRNWVIDLHSWFLAWSLFFHACIIFRHMTDKIGKYQCFISKLASQYSFNAWYGYYQAFRVFISSNPLASNWDSCKENIYNVINRITRSFILKLRRQFVICYLKKLYIRLDIPL